MIRRLTVACSAAVVLAAVGEFLRAGASPAPRRHRRAPSRAQPREAAAESAFDLTGSGCMAAGRTIRSASRRQPASSSRPRRSCTTTPRGKRRPRTRFIATTSASAGRRGSAHHDARLADRDDAVPDRDLHDQRVHEQPADRLHDGRPHSDPDVVVPSWNGESIGRWEGDTLVVDTKHFTGHHHWVDSGVPASDALHIVERIKPLNDGNTCRLSTS